MGNEEPLADLYGQLLQEVQAFHAQKGGKRAGPERDTSVIRAFKTYTLAQVFRILGEEPDEIPAHLPEWSASFLVALYGCWCSARRSAGGERVPIDVLEYLGVPARSQGRQVSRLQKVLSSLNKCLKRWHIPRKTLDGYCLQQLEPPPPEPALKPYLEALKAYCDRLPLVGLMEVARQAELRKPDELRRVYQELDARPWAGEGRADPRAEAPEAVWRLLARHPQVVLLGEPGGGKSSLLYRLALALAEAWPEKGQPQGLPDGWSPPPLPLLVDLGALARGGFPGDDGNPLGLARQGLPWRDEEAWKGCGEEQWRLLERELKSDGGKVLLLLDALDEAPEDDRPRVVDWILKVVRGCPGVCRVIATCREPSYRDGRVRLPEQYRVFKLEPLDDDRVERFVEAWYGAQELESAERERRVRDLLEQVLPGGPQGDLRRLAGNPMLLTALAILHQVGGGKLRGRLVEVLSQLVELLVQVWRKAKEGEETLPRVLEWLLEDEDSAGWRESRLGGLHQALAFAVHWLEDHGQAPERGRLKDFLVHHLERADLPPPGQGERQSDRRVRREGCAAEFLRYAEHRVGLLQGKGGGTFDFAHRRLREYLAGCWLLRESEVTLPKEWQELAVPERVPPAGDEGLFAGLDALARLQALSPTDHWEEAVRLGAEDLLVGRGEWRLRTLSRALLPRRLPSAGDPAALRRARWAARMAGILGEEWLRQHDSDHLGEVREFLQQAMRGRLKGGNLRPSPLPPRERARFGEVLAPLDHGQGVQPGGRGPRFRGREAF
ncbi:MAG TPA: hypothetical protein VNO81_11440, partial [Candidatus Nitrosotenuis sp.]|nr:hypothetical protein [Candidatus Nitrosotenuis sp.]